MRTIEDDAPTNNRLEVVGTKEEGYAVYLYTFLGTDPKTGKVEYKKRLVCLSPTLSVAIKTEVYEEESYFNLGGEQEQ